jgi:hypothetical protein
MQVEVAQFVGNDEAAPSHTLYPGTDTNKTSIRLARNNAAVGGIETSLNYIETTFRGEDGQLNVLGGLHPEIVQRLPSGVA